MKKFQMLMALLCLGLLPACSSNSSTSTSAPTLTSIQITLTTPSVAAGLTDQLTATGQYSDGTSKDLTASVTWTSSNTSVATVSAGVVTTLTQGSAKITGTLSGVSGSVTLTVGAPVITKLVVSSTIASIARGTTVQFTATGTLSNGTTENATGLVTWSSSNPSVASINVNGAQGLAMGLTAGTSNITATANGVSSSATLTVTSATLTSISVTPLSALIPLGTVQQFTATGTFSDSTTQDITGTVVWIASPTSVASITVSGLATGKDLGTVTITATSGAINNSVMATVNAADLSSIAVLPATSTIAQGTTQQFSAIGTFDDGSTHNLTAQVAWSSSLPAAASIGSSTGLAKGLSQGTTTITATLGTTVGTTTLEVTTATIVSISVTPTGRTIAPTTELSFTATGTFSDSSTQVITTDATWTSSDTAVATVGPEGVATAVAAGTTNITAAFGGQSGLAALTVSSVTLKSIAVAPSTAVLAPASTLSYTATGTFSDGSTANVTDVVTWSSSATNVASISSFGQVTGQSAGTAIITAHLSSVTVTPAIASVAEQTATQFNAIGTFADNSTQNLTSSVSWTSSPASIATVSNASPTKGLATGVAPGTATITALFAGQSGAATLTVTNATLDSITVAPDTTTISLGGTQQFTATGNFSDGSSENLTAQVTWSSSEVSVATISPGGLASTAGKGSTTITAKMNGVSGTAALTVD